VAKLQKIASIALPLAGVSLNLGIVIDIRHYSFREPPEI
jgi:hypothetical protein